MGAGGTNSDIPEELWNELQAAEQRRLEAQVEYDPAFTAQLGRISDMMPAVAETIVNILFNKPQKQD